MSEKHVSTVASFRGGKHVVVDIKRADGTPLQPGDIVAGGSYVIDPITGISNVEGSPPHPPTGE